MLLLALESIKIVELKIQKLVPKQLKLSSQKVMEIFPQLSQIPRQKQSSSKANYRI